jgi:hypothetical protein
MKEGVLPGIFERVMSEAGFVLEMCSGKAAWTIIPSDNITIDLDAVTKRIEEAGWNCTIRNRLCNIFIGKAGLTLFPSGRLLVKSGDEELARKIGALHVETWLADI